MFGCVTISFTVHGFTLTAYSADEDSPIIAGTFGLNRKGFSPLLPFIPGTITSMDITATGETLNYNVTQYMGLKISNRSIIHRNLNRCVEVLITIERLYQFTTVNSTLI